MRNTSLYTVRMQAANGMLPRQLGKVPLANPSSSQRLLPVSCFPSGSTSLSTKLLLPMLETPAALLSPAQARSGCHAFVSTPSPGHPSRPRQPMGAGPICATPRTGGSWGPSNWAKGRSQTLAAHRGYFGQGSSCLPGQEAEELAREQCPQEQPPALLCSPLEQLLGLTCPPTHTWMLSLWPHHLPAGGDQGTVSASPQ